MTRAFLAISLYSCALTAQVPAPASAILLRGATVHTISGPVIPNGSILIRDGKIIGVGRDLPAPEGATIIDIPGQQVYPGMIDSASRLAMDNSDSEEPGLLNPQLRSFNAVDPASEQIPAARSNGVTSAVTLPDGELISGQLSLLRLNGSSGDSLSAAPLIAIHLRFPALATLPVPPHEPVADDDEPTTAVEPKPIPYAAAKAKYQAQLKELNAFFLAARRYRQATLAGTLGKAKQPALNLRYQAMLPVLAGEIPLFVTAVREREIREAIAFAEAQKIRIILADASEAYKALPLIKAHNIPVVLGPTLALPLNRDDPYDRSFTTPGDLYRAGIKFSIATFSARSVKNLPYQAAAAVPFGLPEEEAYKAVSLNAAEILGVSKRLGSIDEGKSADLIVTDGNPLEAATHVTRVIIDGKMIDLATRQQTLKDKYSAR